MPIRETITNVDLHLQITTRGLEDQTIIFVSLPRIEGLLGGGTALSFSLAKDLETRKRPETATRINFGPGEKVPATPYEQLVFLQRLYDENQAPNKPHHKAVLVTPASSTKQGGEGYYFITLKEPREGQLGLFHIIKTDQQGNIMTEIDAEK